jgi:hypothetical protein
MAACTQWRRQILGAAVGLSAVWAVTIWQGCFLLPPPEYPACKGPPTEQDIEAARGAHAAATRLYEKGSHERAIDTWLAAYELDCSAHGLLINIARGYEQLGDDDEKLRALETYIARAGKDADLKIVEEVAALKANRAGASPASNGSASATNSDGAAPPAPGTSSPTGPGQPDGTSSATSEDAGASLPAQQ